MLLLGQNSLQFNILSSQGYDSGSDAKNGTEAVMRAAPDAKVEELD